MKIEKRYRPLVAYPRIRFLYDSRVQRPSPRLHTIQKRNTMKIRLKPVYRDTSSETPENITTPQNIHKGPAQWLQPFQFKFDDSNDIIETEDKSTRIFNNQQTSTSTIEPLTSSKKPKRTKSTRTSQTPSETINISSFSSFKEFSETTTTTTGSFISVNSTNQNDFLKNCDKNLTRLTVFYSNIDKLNCVESVHNQSLLKCIDDLLETKLIFKIGSFYFVQLQPLYISRHKMLCFYKNNTQVSGRSLKTTSQSPLEYDYEDEVNNFDQARSNILVANSSSTSTSIPVPRLIDNVSPPYSASPRMIDGFSCSVITKKPTNRKKLIWKVYLVLKNQTCVPESSKLPIDETLIATNMESSILSSTSSSLDFDNFSTEGPDNKVLTKSIFFYFLYF